MNSKINEKKRNGRLIFKGERLIISALIENGFFFFILGMLNLKRVYTYNMLPYDYEFISSILIIYSFLCIIGAKYWKIRAVSTVNSWLLFIGFIAYGYISIFFSGPYTLLMYSIVIFNLLLSIGGLIINTYLRWPRGFGNIKIVILFMIIMIVYRTQVIASPIDLFVFIFPILTIFILSIPWLIKGWKHIRNHNYNPLKFIPTMWNYRFFNKTHLNIRRWRKIGFIFTIIISISVIGSGYFNHWNKTIVIKAPEDFKTTSSYWGPPSLNLVEVNSKILPVDNRTLLVSNTTLGITPLPESFINGTLAYVESVKVNGSDENYLDYKNGGRSYPNGTIILSKELPSLNSVNITFKYVLNNKVLQYLNISQSTLILNYHGDFIYSNNIFESIEKTYLLQLLDFWHIKFYLDIYNGYDFPHVFNYLDSIPIGYDTLNWAHGKWKMFLGISFDFEPGSEAVPQGNPGGINLTIGETFSSDSKWDKMKRNWYQMNEQNQSLIKEATAAYEKLYSYASSLGYKTYITTGQKELYDAADGKIDITRCPVLPLSKNPDVLYGQMNYQDSNEKEGRYRVYSGCKNQITLLGDQGKTILLGWLKVNTSYYTDDEIGLERYIEDCKIAQATGITEIFHAPLYRMQNKWGDIAILRLHEALNNEPKKEITIRVPVGELDESATYEAIKTINLFVYAIPFYVFLAANITFFGPFAIINRLKIIRKRNEQLCVMEIEKEKKI